MKLEMRSKKLIFSIQAGLLFSAISLYPAYADVLVLKSGEQVEGKITEKTDQYIKIDIGGMPVTYFLDEIDKAVAASKESDNKTTDPPQEHAASAHTLLTPATVNATSQEDFEQNKDKVSKEIYALLLAFFKGFCSNERTESLKSIDDYISKKDFKDCTSALNDNCMAYDRFMEQERTRVISMELLEFSNFTMNQLNVTEPNANAVVNVRRKILGKNKKIVTKDRSWYVTLQKEEGAWKITGLTGIKP